MTGAPGFVVRAATGEITPRAPGPLAGYAARGTRASTGTHDPLEVSLVWMTDARGASVVWVTIDAIAVSLELSAELTEAVVTGLEASPVVIACASHTHSGPLGWTGALHPGDSGDRDPDAVATLLDAVTALAAGLRTRRPQPVRLSWREAVIDGVGTNRLSPHGPHDPTAGILSMERSDRGGLEAVLLDYATHPTVLPPANLAWSADWPGAARAVMRAALEAEGSFSDRADPPVVVGFLQGAAGDVSTRFTRTRQDFPEAARLGSRLAGSVGMALAGRGEELTGPIRTLRGVVTLPTRLLPPRDAADEAVTVAELDLAATPGAPRDPLVRLAQTRLDGARVQRTLAAAGLPALIELPIQIVAIGDHAWVHCPVELFASLGLEVRRRSPFAVTRVIGYSGGYFGYLADEAAHAAGSYEALSSRFPPEAGARFVDLVVALLDRIHTETEESS